MIKVISNSYDLNHSFLNESLADDTDSEGLTTITPVLSRASDSRLLTEVDSTRTPPRSHFHAVALIICSIGRLLSNARAALNRAQADSKEAFARYSACLEAEYIARQQVTVAEERHDALCESYSTFWDKTLIELPQSCHLLINIVQRMQKVIP